MIQKIGAVLTKVIKPTKSYEKIMHSFITAEQELIMLAEQEHEYELEQMDAAQKAVDEANASIERRKRMDNTINKLANLIG